MAKKNEQRDRKATENKGRKELETSEVSSYNWRAERSRKALRAAVLQEAQKVP